VFGVPRALEHPAWIAVYAYSLIVLMSRWESHSHCWSGVCERMNTLVVCDCDCWHETADWSCIAVSYCTLFMAALCCMAYRWLIHVALSWAALLDVCNHTVERRRAGLASREAMLLSLRAVGGGAGAPCDCESLAAAASCPSVRAEVPRNAATDLSGLCVCG